MISKKKISNYNKEKLQGKIFKPITIQGIVIIYAIIIGNNIVQQADINWSNLILGNEALAQMNIKIRIDVLKAKFKLLDGLNKKPDKRKL